MVMERLHDNDTFEHRGYTFRVRFERDDYMGEPWKEHDGHGVVTDWTSRDKAPYERILVSDRHGRSRRYYDVQASTKLARKDGWGCSHGRHVATLENPPTRAAHQVYWHGHTSQGAATACAVNEDFENLRAWCNDEWEWTRVVVTLDGEDYMEALSGIDGYRDGKYCTEVAYELADEILSRVEVANPDIQLSVN
jgi:hypothetical protein